MINREQMERAVRAQGLEFLGIVAVEEEKAFAQFVSWRAGLKHAGMSYLEKNDAVRADPRQVLAGAKTAVVAGLPYYLGDTYDEVMAGPPRAAQYGRIADYHRVLRRKLETVAGELGLLFPGAGFRAAVDTVPILERALAAKSEKGFIGKNTCFIHPRKGSFLLLGELFSTLALTVDAPAQVDPSRHTEDGGCGICDRCQVKCPTGALNEDYQIDARRCLAYWTIEHRGTIPVEFWPWLGVYYFGCDICQLVCPYNKKEEKFEKPSELAERSFPDLFTVATMDQKAYELYFGGTALTRAKREGLRRNALIAMAVTRHPRLAEALAQIDIDGGFPLEATREQIAASTFS